MSSEKQLVRDMNLTKHFKKINFNQLCKLVREIKERTDIQTIDLKALGSDLDYKGLKLAIKEEYGVDLNNDLKEQVDKNDHHEAEGRKLYEKEIKEALNNSIQEIKENNPQIKQYFNILREYTKVVATGFINSMVVQGVGGIGKSFMVLETLNEAGLKLGADYELVSGFSTALELYHIAYNNHNKILIFDDCSGLFDSEKAIAILKSLMWSATKHRFISYYTTSDKLKAPSRFEFTGRVIIVINDIPHLNRSLKALLSRALSIEVSFKYTDIIKIMYELAKKDYNGLAQAQRYEVIDFIKENTDYTTTDLNFRTLYKAFDLRRYGDNWRELVTGLFNKNETLELIKRLVNSGLNVREQIREFEAQTGKSRATYFRLKTKLNKLL